MKKTMKKMIAIACIAFVGMIGTASAAVLTKTVNMCGATAQADFWIKAGAAVVKDTYNCTSGASDWWTSQTYLIIRATGCAIDDATHDDTVYVRYTGSNSDGGCNKYTCQDETYAKASSCSFNGAGSCTASETAPCMMGCADVPCKTLCAPSTTGWEKGYKDCLAGKTRSTFEASCIQTDPDYPYPGIIVPFGFIANNKVTHYVCDYSEVDAKIADEAKVPSDVHWAYYKDGWQIDLDPNSINNLLSCRGDFKCLSGFCQDGNQSNDPAGAGYDPNYPSRKSCTTAADCKYTALVPKGKVEPLDNLSSLMAIHIFTGAVDNWRDFGTGFPNLPIIKCMRHSGSGTHQTFVDGIVGKGRGTVTRFSTTTCDPNNIVSSTWHYKSSSDLTTDCVERFDGGVGYVDADKVMYRAGLVNGIHQMKLDGVAPSRYDVMSGKYPFWAAQTCFADDCVDAIDPDLLDILDDIQTQASNPKYLTFENFGQSAYFWATDDEMYVYKQGNDPKSWIKSKTVRPPVGYE